MNIRTTKIANLLYLSIGLNLITSLIGNNVKIIDYESDYNKRLTSEMIHIKCNQSSINKKEDIFTLNRIYFPLLKILDS